LTFFLQLPDIVKTAYGTALALREFAANEALALGAAALLS
jgi:hypothetical protein